MSFYSTADPRGKAENIKVADMKYSRNVYYCMSRQNDKLLWPEVLTSDNVAVKQYLSRRKENYPSQEYLEHGETFQSFCDIFEKDPKEGCSYLEVLLVTNFC